MSGSSGEEKSDHPEKSSSRENQMRKKQLLGFSKEDSVVVTWLQSQKILTVIISRVSELSAYYQTGSTEDSATALLCTRRRFVQNNFFFFFFLKFIFILSVIKLNIEYHMAVFVVVVCYFKFKSKSVTNRAEWSNILRPSYELQVTLSQSHVGFVNKPKQHI